MIRDQCRTRFRSVLLMTSESPMTFGTTQTTVESIELSAKWNRNYHSRQQLKTTTWDYNSGPRTWMHVQRLPCDLWCMPIFRTWIQANARANKLFFWCMRMHRVRNTSSHAAISVFIGNNAYLVTDSRRLCECFLCTPTCDPQRFSRIVCYM